MLQRQPQLGVVGLQPLTHGGAPGEQRARLRPKRRRPRPQRRLLGDPLPGLGHDLQRARAAAGPVEPGRHLRRQRARVGESERGRAGHRLLADLHQPRRRGAAVQGRGRPGGHPAQHLPSAPAVVGWSAAQDLVEDGAQGVDVAARVDLVDLAAGLLRRHVSGGARHCAHAGDPGRVPAAVGGHRRLGAAGDLGEAPVHDERLAALAQHDVGGLEVPVHHAPVVGVGHRLAHPQEGVHQAAERPAPRGAPVHVDDDLPQRVPPHLAHCEEVAAVAHAAQLVNRHDARVLELGGGLRLLQKARDDAGAVQQLGVEELDGQGAPQHPVAHPPHSPHPALAQRPQVLIARVRPQPQPVLDASPGRQRGVCDERGARRQRALGGAARQGGGRGVALVGDVAEEVMEIGEQGGGDLVAALEIGQEVLEHRSLWAGWYRLGDERRALR